MSATYLFWILARIEDDRDLNDIFNYTEDDLEVARGHPALANAIHGPFQQFLERSLALIFYQ